METLIHADIFFFVATIGFICLWGLLVIALISVIRLFRSVLRITRTIEKDVASLSQETRGLIRSLQESKLFKIIFGK